MKYFEELLNINKKYIKDDNNIRINNLEKVYLMLDEFYNKEFNLDDFIKLCIRLFNMQIFYDGNSRTILTYLTMVIENNGYYFDFDKAIEGSIEIRKIFPAVYDLDEELTDHEVNKIRNYIYLKEDSKGRK